MPRQLPQLTHGSTVRALLTLAVPIVIANILQTAYQLIDTFWVGRLGASAVAAVSLSFPLIFLLISLGTGLSVAGTILVAQYHGRGDREAVDEVSAQATLGIIVLSVLLAVVGFEAAPAIVAFLGAADDVLPQAADYLRVSFLGLPFLFAYVIFQSLLRGVGDARTPLLIVTGTVVLNFFLDPLFILGLGPVPAMGVSGAALATVITQGLAAIIGLAMLFSGRYGVHLTRRHLWPNLATQWQLFSLGMPAAVEQSTRALGLMLMTTLVAGFGTITLAAYGIGTRMLSFVIIPALGLSLATSTVVAQNMGAGKIDRAERTAWLGTAIAFASLTLVGLLAFFLAEPIVAVFVPDAQAVIEQGADFLRITALSFGLLGTHIVITGAFRGTGNTMVAMALALISLWVLQFPLAWILSARTELAEFGIWISYPVQSFLTALIACIWFWRGGWKRKQLIEAPDEEEQRSRVELASLNDPSVR